jgi:hypothetical protein
MSYWVIPRRVDRTGAQLAAAPGERPDDLLGRLTKYVPTPLLTLYAAAYGALVSFKLGAVPGRWAVGILAAMSLAALIAWTRKKAPQGVVRDAHLVVSPVAFVVWAYTISASLLGPWFIGWLALLGQAAVALLAWVVEPVEEVQADGAQQPAAADTPPNNPENRPQ